jgi:hypothetical protein
MQPIPLRPRSATEIVDASFRLCRAYYGPLVTATAIIVAPALLLALLLPAEATQLADILVNLLFVVSDGAVIAIVSEVYLGRPAVASTGLRAVQGRIGSLIGSSLLRNVLVGLGLILFVVPGVIAFVLTFAMPMAIVLEGEYTSAALSRSRELARGHFGHVLGTLVLLVIIVFGMMIGVGIALGLAAETLGITDRTVSLVLNLALTALYPLFSVGGTLLYYDLRIRKEGFDLEMMAQDLLGETVPASAAGRVALPPVA